MRDQIAAECEYRLRLKPPARLFLDPGGQPLMLSRGPAGKSGRRKIELADWDGDGDLDLIVDSDSAAWYENTGTQEEPVLVFRGDLAPRKLPGHNPCPNVADWNGDGRLDLLIGAEDGFLYYFDRRFLDAPAGSAMADPYNLRRGRPWPTPTASGCTPAR